MVLVTAIASVGSVSVSKVSLRIAAQQSTAWVRTAQHSTAQQPEAGEEGQYRDQAGVHCRGALGELLGCSLQLSQQEGVKGGVAVEELFPRDGPPGRLPLHSVKCQAADTHVASSRGIAIKPSPRSACNGTSGKGVLVQRLYCALVHCVNITASSAARSTITTNRLMHRHVSSDIEISTSASQHQAVSRH